MDSTLQKILKNINASIISRFAAYLYIEKYPEELSELVQIAINFKDKKHHKAIWIIETIAERTPIQLVPYFDLVLDACPKYKHESAIRGISRVIYFIAISESITLVKNQKDKAIEICLDWLIGDAKVAPKAYAMYTLSHYTKDHEWIKEELRIVINKDFAHQSAGYKAAAKEVLKKINN